MTKLVQQVEAAHQSIQRFALLSDKRLLHFLASCALTPDGLALALTTAIELSGRIDRTELIKQICIAFGRRFKLGERVKVELAELALTGVSIRDVDVDVDNHPLHHWLACGFASGAEGLPVSVPFPALFNDAGILVSGISRFTNFGQPFHWQDFEALVPHIIRLRCSSLCRINKNRRATTNDIFGNGPAINVNLCAHMAVVTCAHQWLVPKRGKVQSRAEQLKVSGPEYMVDTTSAQSLRFASSTHIFAAADGNVHFDGHASFEMEQGGEILVCYQVKHTNVDSTNEQYFNWDKVETWLTVARDFMRGYPCAERLFAMVTNKEVLACLRNCLPIFVLFVGKLWVISLLRVCWRLLGWQQIDDVGIVGQYRVYEVG